MTGALDRSRPPAPGVVRAFSFPRFHRRRLTTGLELWLAPIDRLPLVDVEIVLDAGATWDPPGRPGVANFTAAVVDEGTARRDARQIAETVEKLGGSLSSGADWDSLDVGCGLLARHLDTGLELIAEIVREPAFPAPEVERTRGQLLAEIERRGAQPSAIAGRHLLAAIYGDSAYGRPRIGTADDVAAIERKDLVRFHHRHASPANAALVLCGDFDPAAATTRLEELLGDWPAAATPERRLPEPPVAEAAATAEGRRIVLVDRPGAQTELRLGHSGPARDNPDFLPATILNAILGGRFMSRINLNLRERHGYTYGASSYFDWRRGPGPFVVSTAVATEHAAAAAREVIREIERLRREPVEAAELEETRSYLIGVFPYSTQRLSGIGARLRQMAIHRLPDDYYSGWVERVAAVTADDVWRSARAFLQPDRLSIVAVGPAAELEPGFAELGPVEIVEPADAEAPVRDR